MNLFNEHSCLCDIAVTRLISYMRSVYLAVSTRMQFYSSVLRKELFTGVLTINCSEYLEKLTGEFFSN